ncbi:hypothetical protein [Desulfobulbus alkaliphilus]|uniref:hypothetical protein n=1 Tax=Desulfobulbus alkaliphilus TaxID=869814 RepID=UPI0019640F0D|nr:hypothetical protein [Desulfobulbus alkaliphilus]MBM9536122.1 hypothetical protein [Desulfobulbus alkaliphilus]
MVKKTKKKSSARHAIVHQVMKHIQRSQHGKSIDLAEIRQAHEMAENLEATVVSDDELSGFDPLHALYAYAQNIIQTWALYLLRLPECRKIASNLAEADREYMPAYPPMSPITSSYFCYWAFFDLKAGPGKESIGDIVIKVSQKLSSLQNLLTLYQNMQDSRMGLYFHEGSKGKRIRLKELITEKELTCISPSGYLGMPGELWFARILPDPFPAYPFGYAVVIATPYVVGKNEGGFFKNTGCLQEWLAFFERTLPKTGESDRRRAYEMLMKDGLGQHYWNEFIFTSYANYTDNVVFLAGIPDLPESMPHSEQNALY